VKILFDQGVPVPLRRELGAHEIVTAHELGWGELKNGDLLKKAEQEGFEAIVTTDQNLRYQQNLKGRQLSILVLMTTDWRTIRSHVDLIVAAVRALQPNKYRELNFPG
jgi:predicted nuclease of predicted toxin-antitoxin system